MNRFGHLFAISAAVTASLMPSFGADDSTDALRRKLAPHFQPPPELANDFGAYKSPLVFDDGRKVKTADDWQLRRKEIRKTWHDALGAWPPLVEKPKIEYLEKERRDN